MRERGVEQKHAREGGGAKTSRLSEAMPDDAPFFVR